MWVEIGSLSKRLKHLSLITSTKRCVSKTVVKPLHFLRAKEGSLNLQSIPYHDDEYLAMYKNRCVSVLYLDDIESIPKSSYVFLSI